VLEEKPMTNVINFMDGLWGRALRIVVGVTLIACGLFVLGGTIGIILAIIGLVALVMGAIGRCLLELVGPPAGTR
jgi:hypothetical protein